MLLSSLLLIPIIGVFAIWINKDSRASVLNLKLIALTTSIIILISIFCVFLSVFKACLPFMLYISTLGLTLLYLEDCKLSNNKFIKYIEIFSIVIMFICLVFYAYSILDTSLINYVVPDNTVTETKSTSSTHCHVSLGNNSSINGIDTIHDNGVRHSVHTATGNSRLIMGSINIPKLEIGNDVADSIATSLSSFGASIGLGASILGVSMAISKGISKASIPPVQKTGIILAGTAAGGFIYMGIMGIHRKNAVNSSIYVNASTQTPANITNQGNTVTESTTNHLMDMDNYTPLEMLLQSIHGLSSMSLFLIFILSVQLFYRYYINDKPSLKLVEYLLPETYSNKLKELIYKLIALNKKMSIFYIVIVILVLLISMLGLSYFSLELAQNLDDYINLHKTFKK